MGTIFKVSIHSEKSRNKVEDIVQGSFKIADEMDDRFSDYSAESEVSKFNEFIVATEPHIIHQMKKKFQKIILKFT